MNTENNKLKTIEIGCSEYPETIWKKTYHENDNLRPIIYEIDYLARKKYDEGLVTLKQFLAMIKEACDKLNFYYSEQYQLDLLKEENKCHARFTYQNESSLKKIPLYGIVDLSISRKGKIIQHSLHDYTILLNDIEYKSFMLDLAKSMYSSRRCY